MMVIALNDIGYLFYVTGYQILNNHLLRENNKRHTAQDRGRRKHPLTHTPYARNIYFLKIADRGLG